MEFVLIAIAILVVALIAGVSLLVGRGRRTVRLDEDAVRRLVDAAEVGGDLAGGAEARIQTAVGVVASESQLNLAANEGRTDGHDLAVGLECGSVDVVELREVSRNDTGRIKRRIQCSIGVVAHEAKLKLPPLVEV